MTRPEQTAATALDGVAGVRAQAGYQVRQQVRRVAVEVFGAVTVEQPVAGFELLTRTELDDPLAGMRAARLVADVAAGQLREWALRARGTGRSWDDVATALDLTSDDPDFPRSLGEVAWDWLVEHRPPPPAPPRWGLGPVSAVWTCTTCRARVRDTGPFESHPDDREHGHIPGCTRHATEIAAWRRDQAHDDEQDGEDR